MKSLGPLVFTMYLYWILPTIWLVWYIYSRKVVLQAMSANEHTELNMHMPSHPATSKRVMLIFGWGGAQARHIGKIASTYTERNIAVISQTSPMVTFLDQGMAPAKVLPMVLKLHSYLQSLPPQQYVFFV